MPAHRIHTLAGGRGGSPKNCYSLMNTFPWRRREVRTKEWGFVGKGGGDADGAEGEESAAVTRTKCGGGDDERRWRGRGP
jgi:hypothetical protein